MDIKEQEYGGYDESNLLVLPSKKRDSKVKKKEGNITRILSKKQRKNLEKIVDKKKKKENRSTLLESLASVQIPSEELQQYTSLSAFQTKGLKKHFWEQQYGVVNKRKLTDNIDQDTKTLSSIAGSNKKRRLALLAGYNDNDSDDDTKNNVKNPNFVGLEYSDDDTEEENESEDEKEIEPELEEVIASKEDATMKVSGNEIAEEIIKPSPITKPIEYKPAVYVHLDRTPEIQAARLKLPILGEEQVIMETISENSIIILAGETGSGKTTQIPQFLYEAGYAEHKLIGITEPRRVAAISMSIRVAKEMNLSSDICSYLIRFEGNTTEKTKIKFMTDGVLLKEIESDFILSKYSVIILDEAHERSVYTDILVGLLSRIVPLRLKRGNPLKLIIMSATLRVEDFTENKKLFKRTPPLISVDSRQFPVTIHFNKRTSDDYIKEAFNKTVKIHTKLPEGGILIFVTGQNEVQGLVNKLRKTFPFKGDLRNQKRGAKFQKNETQVYSDDDDGFNKNMEKAIKNSKKAKRKLASQISLPHIDLDSYSLPADDTDGDLLCENEDEFLLNDDDVDLDSDDDDDSLNVVGLNNSQPLWVLPMYSLLTTDKQARVFEDPPEGTRLCVVSTNVSETSLTIPNVKYVVDCGRQKTRLYDKITGVSAFVVTFTSKASANQRAGRAGRTSAGHCYRLFSSAVFNDEMEEFALPEIQKKPVDDLMLQMKCMGIDKVVNFPFPSPPDSLQLKMAEARLKLLGALEDQQLKGSEITTKVTPLGQAISVFPVAPRFGKMLALSHQQHLLPYTICMVAALSVQEVLHEVSFVSNETNTKKTKWFLRRKAWAGIGNSLYLGDPMVLLRAVGASEFAGYQGKLIEFCQENGLRPKAISEIRKLRKQLTNEINLNINDLNLCVDPKMEPPTDIQAKLLRQILLAGMGDQIARRIPNDEIKDKQDKIKFKYAYNCPEMEEPVFMHSSSVLKKKQPDWVIYQEVYEIQNGDSTKMFIRGISAIEPEWLPKYVPKLCNMGPPLSEPVPRFNQSNGRMYCHVAATFGKSGWVLPVTEVEFPMNFDSFRYFLFTLYYSYFL